MAKGTPDLSRMAVVDSHFRAAVEPALLAQLRADVLVQLDEAPDCEICAEDLLAEMMNLVDLNVATLLRDRFHPDTFVADERAVFQKLQGMRRLDSALREVAGRIQPN